MCVVVFITEQLTFFNSLHLAIDFVKLSQNQRSDKNVLIIPAEQCRYCQSSNIYFQEIHYLGRCRIASRDLKCISSFFHFWKNPVSHNCEQLLLKSLMLVLWWRTKFTQTHIPPIIDRNVKRNLYKKFTRKITVVLCYYNYYIVTIVLMQMF